MIATLKRPVDQLEARVKPADEPEEFVIEFIGPEKEVVDTLVIRPGATFTDQRSRVQIRPTS
jgi:hypothetical protein